MSIDRSVADALKANGYEIGNPLGSGKTRLVYQVEYQDEGGLRQERVAKVPMDGLGADSLGAQVHTSRWQINTREIAAANRLDHENISRAIQSLRTDDGRLITIEPFHQGMVDLEQHIKGRGPLTKRRFKRVFTPLVDALSYLHQDKGVVHRDIKPSNVLIGTDDKVLLTDLENSIALAEVEHKHLPTRGGAPFTTTDLLGAWSGGEPACASQRSDIYAMATTMAYALTGEEPFSYALRESEGGVAMDIDGRERKVSLFDGDQRIPHDQIKFHHHKKVRAALRKLPRFIRPVIKKAWSDEGYRSTAEFQRDLDTALSSKAPGVLRRIGQAATVAAAMLGGYSAHSFGQAKKESTKAPVVVAPEEKLARYHFEHFTTKADTYAETMLRRAALQSCAEELEARVRKAGVEQDKNINYWTPALARQGHLDESLVRAWLTAASLADSQKMHKEQGNGFLFPTYVPRMFVADPIIGWDAGIHIDMKRYPGGLHFLETFLDKYERLPELFADYYFEERELAEAKKRSGSEHYLPYLTPDGIIKPGFGAALKEIGPERARTVDTTLLLYDMYDGGIHTVLDFQEYPGDPAFAYVQQWIKEDRSKQWSTYLSDAYAREKESGR